MARWSPLPCGLRRHNAPEFTARGGGWLAALDDLRNCLALSEDPPGDCGSDVGRRSCRRTGDGQSAVLDHVRTKRSTAVPQFY